MSSNARFIRGSSFPGSTPSPSLHQNLITGSHSGGQNHLSCCNTETQFLCLCCCLAALPLELLEQTHLQQKFVLPLKLDGLESQSARNFLDIGPIHRRCNILLSRPRQYVFNQAMLVEGPQGSGKTGRCVVQI